MGTPKRPLRAARRLRGRAHAALVRDLERLARLQPGGTPERPLEIDSPARVEVIAASGACPLCEGPLRLAAHTAETVHGVRLRVAHVACTACGTGRALYFRLAGTLPH
jgi:hypothetical protein